jgi:hypothetical protein
MNKEQKINEWIKSTSKIRPELNGFAICPFASKSKNKIITCSIDNIEPIPDLDVIIFLVANDYSLREIKNWVQHYNKKYPNWKFFEDCYNQPTFIGKVKTNNDYFNLILAQPKDKLRKFREQLAKTDYYKQWNEEYLIEILGDDIDVLCSTQTTGTRASLRCPFWSIMTL